MAEIKYQPCPLADKCPDDWCVICGECGAPEGQRTEGCPECDACLNLSRLLLSWTETAQDAIEEGGEDGGT